ncbi:MAG: hypothetical protein V7L25_01585 [Nostoc sp.]|uniref:hypothetical protein n=1 Tax=Nostoc sp. TaxID=1180 RepID=UPI002FEF971B
MLVGWVIGGQQEEIAPHSVRLLLSALAVVARVTLLVINISAEVAEGHDSEHYSNSTEAMSTTGTAAAPSSQKSQGLEISLDGDKNATVRKRANLALQVEDATIGQPITDVALQVKAIATEHNLIGLTQKTS